MKCLICEKKFDNQRGLGCHVRRQHKMSTHEYRLEFNLHRRCLTCNKIIGFKNKGNYCDKHRDRTGKNNPFYGKTHDREMIERTKNKLSKISKTLWEDPKYREKIKQTTTGLKRTDKFKKEQSQRVKKWYEDNPNQREIRSYHMKKTWADGKIEPNINSINESKGERDLLALCKKMFPNDNVRKTTLKIGGRWFYPDTRIGKNIIIEYYGDYWHANPQKYKQNEIIEYPGKRKISVDDIHKKDNERIQTLTEGGFDVLIIWQTDFFDINKTEQQIKEFYNEKKNFKSKI